MTNHVHFIAVPKKEDSLSKCFSDTHVRYTRRINFRERWRGHLWQGRFGSSPLDEKHRLAAVRYVERNPVRARRVSVPWRYKWSSASFHVGINDTDALISGDEMLRENVKDWKEYLLEQGDAEEIERIRKEGISGRPVGDKKFIKKMERKFKRRLARGIPGRPKIGNTLNN